MLPSVWRATDRFTSSPPFSSPRSAGQRLLGSASAVLDRPHADESAELQRVSDSSLDSYRLGYSRRSSLSL